MLPQASYPKKQHSVVISSDARTDPNSVQFLNAAGLDPVAVSSTVIGTFSFPGHKEVRHLGTKGGRVVPTALFSS